MPNVRLTINGKKHSIDADGDMPLLFVLRDILGLTGTKYGCGEGLCGSCTVLEDGAPTRSCQVRLSSTEGNHYTTIEGLSKDGSDPCQQAWLEEQVSQCGYCQSGQIMQAAALLAKNYYPTEQEITDGMNGVICRCGTYQRIRAAIKSAAEEDI